MKQAKVFGIGLSRTGTTTLTHALELLGYRTKHFPKIRRNIETADYEPALLDGYDAATDSSIAMIFPHLDEHYPGSKFILTVRERASWLDSTQHYYERRDQEWDEAGTGEPARFWRLAVFGCHGFSRERFGYVYSRHVREVEHHFRDRPDDLLVLNICGGQGWPELCAFLDVPEPCQPFPHENRGVETDVRR